MEDNAKLVASLLVIALFLGLIATTFYGLFLAFSASIVFGVVVLFVEPLPMVLGLLGLFGHPEIAARLVEFFSKLLS